MEIIQLDGYFAGDTHLFIGSEKTALIDTGMEYCSEKLVEDVKAALNGRPLDYILLSHSHYDHVCGVPALRKEWPDVIVAGHPHCAKILAKEKAIMFMRGMSEQNYLEKDPDHSVVGYPVEAYKVDLELTEGMEVDLGDVRFKIYETPGHTKCCISFYDEINQILYASETTGIVSTKEPMEVESCFITSFESALESIRKLKNLPVKMILQGHRPKDSVKDPETFFERSEVFAKLSRDLVISMYENGVSKEEIVKIYADTFAKRVEGQPYYAFMVNAKAAIDTVIREYEES